MVQSKFQHLWSHQRQLALSFLKWDSCLSRLRCLYSPCIPGFWTVNVFLVWAYCACTCHLGGRFSSWHNCGVEPGKEDKKIPFIEIVKHNLHWRAGFELGYYNQTKPIFLCQEGTTPGFSVLKVSKKIMKSNQTLPSLPFPFLGNSRTFRKKQGYFV